MQRFRTLRPAGLRLGAAAALITSLLAGCATVGDPSTATAQPPSAPSEPPPPASTAAPAKSIPQVPAAPSWSAAPAPSDAESGPAAPQYRDLWERIRNGFAMPEMDTPLVAQKERFYSSKPEYLQRMFSRGERYLFYIVEELERRGMPTELALLPFVESAMNPEAVSSAKAAGLWQFIPSTGKAYNLHQNWWVDNRRDPVKSTHAALDYLQRIYEMQGKDWFLALASYNWGEGSVARAMRKNELRDRPTDYLSLDMPEETRHYVPKLIALKHILQRADEFGVTLPPLPNKPYFATIEKTRAIDLKLAAKFAGMSVSEFVALNPAHNRPVISATRNNLIKLPADRVDAFLAAMAQHQAAEKPLATWQPYTLKPGENLEAVAEKAGVAPAELRKANGLRETQRVVAGTRIIAPDPRVEDESRVESFVAPRVYEQVEKPAVYHTVKRKESLASIAKRYGLSAATLAAWNGVKRDVKRGMRLLVSPASTQTVLTDEGGDRRVVASATRPMFVRVSTHAAPTATQAAPATKQVASAPRKAAAAPKAAASRSTASTSAKVARATSARAKPAARSAKAAPQKVARASASNTGAKASPAASRAATRPAAQPRSKTAAGSPAPRQSASSDAKPSKAPVRTASNSRVAMAPESRR